jgi:hypothetical protein
VATGGKAPSGRSRADREARERSRLYQARTAFHEGRQRRRVRDNVIGSIVGAVIVLGAIGSQVAYYSVGPGMPAPGPAPTTTPAPTDNPLAPLLPTSTPEPSPTPE